LQSKPDKFRRDSAEDCWQVIRQSKLVIDGKIRVCSEGKTRTKCKLGGEVSVIVGSHPEFPTMIVRSQCRQEERVDMEDRSRALEPSAGSDHRWIEENLHDL
jgi:hypothetical protein